MSEQTPPLDPDDRTQDDPQVDPEQDGTEPQPEAEPGEDFPGQRLVGHVVTWEADDGSGNVRQQFGIVLGPHPLVEGELDVAPLRGSYERSYAPDDLVLAGS